MIMNDVIVGKPTCYEVYMSYGGFFAPYLNMLGFFICSKYKQLKNVRKYPQQQPQSTNNGESMKREYRNCENGRSHMER